MNYKHGFIAPLILALIALLILGGGAYVYVQNKQTSQSAVVTPPTQATSTAQSSSSEPTSYANKLVACKSLANNSTQQVVDTFRLFIHLPKDVYQYAEQNIQYKTVSGDAVMGSVSNGGRPGQGLDNTPECWSTYYEFSGKGEVDFIVKSMTKGVPDYLVRFLVGPTAQSSNSQTLPHIDSVSAHSVSIGDYYFNITASNLDPLGGYVGNGWISNSHIFVRLISNDGQAGILWEGGSQGGNTVNGNQITTIIVPYQICKISTIATGVCPPDKLMTITPGNYSLTVFVDGRGTSNSVPLTVTPHRTNPGAGGR